VKLKRLKQAPVLIAGCVLTLVGLAQMLRVDFVERFEAITYDWRARQALKFPAPTAANLGFVFIDEKGIVEVKSGRLGYHFGLYWPRQVYGRLVDELAAQGVETVGFDIILGELRQDHAGVNMADGSFVDSDVVFAQAIRRASNVIIAATTDLPPPQLFRTNALAIGDISTDKDSDGILRRARAFRVYPRWHAAFRQVEADPELGIDLRQARVEPGHIVLRRSNGEEINIPVDAENNFELADFGTPPPGTPPKAKAFTEERVWQLGIALAAQHLKLDLEQAEVDLAHGRIALKGPKGIQRIIPVDSEGYFYIDWCLTPDNPRLTTEPIHSLLLQNYQRLRGEKPEPRVDWHNKLAVVGSIAQGDLSDRGATPLAKDAALVSKHWNVANSILTGRFVRRASRATELALIIALGVLTAFLTWQLRVVTAGMAVGILLMAYGACSVLVYAQFRYWLPLVLPIVGAMLVQHFSLVTYRVVFEQKERRRVKSIFSKVVAPEVMNELLRVEKLSLGGARREVTVLFADVRGFTELTDYTQERVTEYVREHKLPPHVAEACYDEFASETLSTVNAYLTRVIDAASREKGTFDKLIGDCVMFFWGAPLAHPHHALACVRAAIAAQREIYKLNQQRAIENQQREIENRARESAGLPPKPPLATLTLGTGINTGMVTAGIMGSDDHQVNFTVFGREVNLASRLEGMSGRGRIFISESTHQHLLRDDPALAATCIEREPMTPKGFNKPVRIYEVPWMPPGEVAEDFQTMLFVKPRSPGAKA
jgi:class 3 adenylate cyclase/CHASE2 domain-containing sensor protein